jgi:hypothetical protein
MEEANHHDLSEYLQDYVKLSKVNRISDERFQYYHYDCLAIIISA